MTEGRRELKALAEKAKAAYAAYEANDSVENYNATEAADIAIVDGSSIHEIVLSLLAALEEAEGRIEAAREAFLNFVADAKKFEQDIDGEYEDGRAVVTIRYDIVTEHHGLWELIGALGFDHRRDETPFDAVCREIEEAPVAALTTKSGEAS